MKYYKTDSRKISFREYWHLSPKGFWVGWLNKVLGRQMNLIRGMPEPLPFQETIIGADKTPREILERLNPAVRDLQKLGFDQFWYYSSQLSLTGGLGYAVEGLHVSRQILAKVIYVSYKNRESFVIALLSGLMDGTVLATTNRKRDFNPIPGRVIRRKIGADAETLFRLHQKELTRFSRKSAPLHLPGLKEVAVFEDMYSRQS